MTGTFDSMSLIIRAWRERWTDWEFGVQLRQMMKCDAGLGDGVALAQALLKQALVGPGTNRLFLGYLKYCASCRIVSLTSILRLVSLEPVSDEDRSPRQGRRLNALLDLITDVINVLPVATNPTKKECLEEAKALLSIVDWLVKVLTLAYTRTEEETSADYSRLVEKVSNLLHTVLVADRFRSALIRVAAHDDRSLAKGLKRTAAEKFRLLIASGGFKRDSSGSTKKSATDLLKECVNILDDIGEAGESGEKLPILTMAELDKESPWDAVLSFVAMLTEVQLHANPAVCGRWLTNLCSLKGMKGVYTFEQVVHAALLLIQNVDESDLSKKLVFLLYKVPAIFEAMHKNGMCKHASDKCDDLKAALLEVQSLSSLLFRVNEICGGDVMEAFVKEVVEKHLLTHESYAEIMNRRRNQPELSKVKLLAGNSEDLLAHVAHVDAKLRQIVAYLSSGERVSPETVFGSLAGLKSPSAGWTPLVVLASVTGRLEPLVDFCLAACEANEEADGNVNPLFETGFLFLAVFAYVVEDEVAEVLRNYPSRNIKDASYQRKFYDFFCTWMDLKGEEILAQKENLVAQVGEQKIEALISGLTDIIDTNSCQLSSVDLCWASLAAAKEIVSAWETNVLGDDDAERLLVKLSEKSAASSAFVYSWIVVKIKSKSCLDAYKLVAALRIVSSNVNVKNDVFGSKLDLFRRLTDEMRRYPDGVDAMDGEETAKKFFVPLMNRAAGVASGGSTPVASSAQKGSGGGAGGAGTAGQKSGGMLHDLGSDVETPPADAFNAACQGGRLQALWRSVMTSKSVVKLAPDLTRRFWRMWRAGGSDWFVRTLVEETFVEAYSEELDTLMGVVLGLFHMDLDSCYSTFVRVLMPQIIISSDKIEFLSEPLASRLAFLFVAVTHCFLMARVEGADAVQMKMKIKRTPSSEDILAAAGRSGEGAKHPTTPAAPSAASKSLTEMFELLKRVTVAASRDAHFDARLEFALCILRESTAAGSRGGGGSPLVPHIPVDLMEWFVMAVEPEMGYEFLLDLVELATKQGRTEAAYLLFLKHRLATYARPGVVMRAREFGKVTRLS